MGEPINPENANHALALGRGWINRDPLDELKHLNAQMGFRGGRWVIELDAAGRKRLADCIAFNEGAQVSHYELPKS